MMGKILGLTVASVSYRVASLGKKLGADTGVSQ